MATHGALACSQCLFHSAQEAAYRFTTRPCTRCLSLCKAVATLHSVNRGAHRNPKRKVSKELQKQRAGLSPPRFLVCIIKNNSVRVSSNNLAHEYFKVKQRQQKAELGVKFKFQRKGQQQRGSPANPEIFARMHVCQCARDTFQRQEARGRQEAKHKQNHNSPKGQKSNIQGG